MLRPSLEQNLAVLQHLVDNAPSACEVGTAGPHPVESLLPAVQVEFVRVFHRVPAGTEPGARLSSQEEVQLAAVRLVRSLYEFPSPDVATIFGSASHHQVAALFLHELLKCISKETMPDTFRALQIEAATASRSIIMQIGPRTTRLCLPGVLSSCVRYLVGAHRGVDAEEVRVRVGLLLEVAMIVALAPECEPEWWAVAHTHIGNNLNACLNPVELTSVAGTPRVARALLNLTGVLLRTPLLLPHRLSLLMQLSLVAHFVLSNVVQLDGSTLPSAGSADVRGGVDVSKLQLLSLATVLSEAVVRDLVLDALRSLQGVPLLHFVSAVCRSPCTRSIVTSDVDVFLRLTRSVVRLVARDLAEEVDLFTHRFPRKFPAGVIDECLACLARACMWGVLERSPVNFLDVLLDDCEAALGDWEQYALHPAILYVVSRVAMWGYNPVERSCGLGSSDAVNTKEIDALALPTPADFVLHGTFERYWEVAAQPHLWNMRDDVEHCTFQQLHHRHVVVAVILRSLGLAAELLRPAQHKKAGKRALSRLVLLTLFSVLEKAAEGGIAQSAALATLASFAGASGCPGPVDFCMAHGSFIIDEATRAIDEPRLRAPALAVLEGTVTFYLSSVPSVARVSGSMPRDHDGEAHIEGLPNTSLTSSLAPMVDELVATRLADFVASVLHVGMDACRAVVAAETPSSARESIEGESMRTVLSLLWAAFALAARINRSVAQLPHDPEQERMTTAFSPAVQDMQTAALDALHQTCTTFGHHGPHTPLAVRAILAGLAVFVTVPEDSRADEPQDPSHSLSQRVGDEESSSQSATLSEPNDHPMCTSLRGSEVGPQCLVGRIWPDGAEPVLPRSHLKTVYHVYLVLLAILREPVASFTAQPSIAAVGMTGGTWPPTSCLARRGTRSGPERRRLMAVPITPGVFAGLEAMWALYKAARSFLIQRMMDEVCPVAYVWYERATLPAIVTTTEQRLQKVIKGLVRGLAAGDTLAREQLQDEEG